MLTKLSCSTFKKINVRMKIMVVDDHVIVRD